MTRWIALSDQPDLPGAPVAGDLSHGILVFEIEMPLAGAGVLLDLRAGSGADEVALSLFYDLGAGLALLHRQGGRVLRHVLPGPLPQRLGVARLSFGWNMSGSGSGRGSGTGWWMEMDLAGQRLRAQGEAAMPIRLADLTALCAGGAGVLRHPAVLWFGAMQGAARPAPMGWLGVATPVNTPRGPVAAGALRPGDRVITRDTGAVALVGVTRVQVPSRGSMAPIRLRAPYFGQETDMLVSPDQPICISGEEAEYLFGVEEVLVLARHLADGQMAVADSRRAVAVGVVLDPGMAELVEADGCWLATAGTEGVTSRRRVLDSYEALPLRNALQRMQRRAV